MKDALIVTALSLVPRRTAAKGMGWFARRRVSRLMTRLFVRAYGVDLSEATGDLGDYPTLEALFTRELKPGMRPIDAGADAMVSPVDGTVAFVGTSTGGQINLGQRTLDIPRLLGADIIYKRSRGGWTIKTDRFLRSSIKRFYAAGS